VDNKFKYGVGKLRMIILNNRNNHKAEYDEALKAYKAQLIVLLEKKLSAAKNGEDVSHQINLAKPREYLSQYDRALRMFELTTQEEVELDSETFAQLVMDEWDWKDSFSTVNNSYKMSNSI
jgi:hypothetical protein